VRKMGIWREYLIEKLADRESAINYLQAILEDYQIFEDSTVVLRSLHTVVEAQGGVSELAKQTDMDPQVLSKMLSNEDTPLIDVLTVVLKVLGYQLSIQPIDPENLNLEAYTDVLDTQNTSTQIAEN
jgi:DNA-binding phage protein